MTSSTLKWLAIATVALLLVMIAVDRTDRSDTVAGGESLVPGLKDHINEITAVTVTGSSETQSVSITRDGDTWQVREKDGYAADVGELRKVLVALAEARKLEEKTANPERFAQLGVAGPETGSGTLIELTGNEIGYRIIVGNAAQTKYRYVRIADEQQSWLIDQNPDLPEDAAGWLAAGLLDIDAARIRTVSIRHADGETIRLEKQSSEDSSYTVLDIPEGRELSYATVANGVAGVLKGLTLDDVRRGAAGEPDATSVFTTFDGLEITVRRYPDGESAWVSVAAAAVPATAADQQPAAEPGAQTAEAEANAINARHSGWQYRIPDYKENLLTRRWTDILKAEE